MSNKLLEGYMQKRDLNGKFLPINFKLLVNKKSEKLAEFLGIMLGDGNVFKKGNSYIVRIAGHKRDDKDYLIKYVKPLINKLFKINVGVYYFKDTNSMHLVINNKNFVKTLEYWGIFPGNKLKNNISIPDWIFGSDRYLEACIRGLIDTDGSVVPITGRNYSYIWFTCNIPNLRKSFEKSMKKLGYKISKWRYSPFRSAEVFIGSKEMIRKYYKRIGFNNPKHNKRFMVPD